MAPPPQVAELARADGTLIAELAQHAAELATQNAAPATLASPAAWRDAVLDIAADLIAVQQGVIEAGPGYVDGVLVAQGASTAADAQVATASLVDMTDGGGSWLRNLVYAPPSAFADAVAAGISTAAAAARGAWVASAVAGDGVTDAARTSRMLSTFTRRERLGYVRMLNGKSCARCAILAGRRYKVSAFRRHPRCDCRMIPAREDVEDSWTTSPKAYFRSLTAAEQDIIFGQAGARAIRLGADMSQVVNAYDGITTVTSFGREVAATTYGTSVRGLYGGYVVQPDGTLARRPASETVRLPSGRRSLRYATPPRLLPDEIFALAEQEGWDRDQLLTQLRRFAYIV